MQKLLRQWSPEIGIALLALFFAYRELGTFPGAWTDEGLFIMVAKHVVNHGVYGIPILGRVWEYPYFLAVGPTVILPVAVSIKLFGLSIAAARIPMTLYILAATVLMYVFAKWISTRDNARWAAALLVTLSAFINTGKPVLGEIPAFFFLILGMLCLESSMSPIRKAFLSGIVFGVAIITKLTYGIIVAALFVVALFFLSLCVLFRKNHKEDFAILFLSCLTADGVYSLWRLLEAIHTTVGGLIEEIDKFVLGGGDLPIFSVLRNNPEILLRIPFLAFVFFAIAGLIGLWSSKTTISTASRWTISVIVLLFTLYFLNSYGWYRHLLPAHLLLIPFVPIGINVVAGKRLAIGILALIVIAQGLWQFSHRGSGNGEAMAEAVHVVSEYFAETDLLIEQPEVMAQLPENPHWVYLVREGVSPSMPKEFMTPGEKYKCWSRLRKLNEEELEQYKTYGIGSVPIGSAYGLTVTPVGNMYIIPPPENCS